MKEMRSYQLQAVNNPWECPRCGRMNAPFNPSCFCNKETGLDIWKQVLEKFPIKTYDSRRCLICNGIHARPQDCINLSMS